MSSDGDFDDIVEELGGFGKYQKRLLYALLSPLFLIMPFPMLHQMFYLHSPAFECIHPEEISPATLGINNQTWKEIFLPIEFLPTYTMGPSVCNYYNFSSSQLDQIRDNWENIANDKDELASLQASATLTECQNFLYDQSEFYDTVVTENNWVCSKANYVPDLFTLAVVGLILGTFIFSGVADFFGRKLSFYIGAATCIIFSLLMIPVSHNFHLFAFFKVAGAFGMLPLFQSPLNILCEISAVGKRGFVIAIACVFWSLGQILFPLVGYLIASWRMIKVVSVVPLAIFFFTWNLLPESPRWLVSKGKTDEATKILTKISETNNVVAPPDLKVRVEKLAAATKEVSLGYLSLFSRMNLGLRTVFCTIGFTASAFIYYQMVINVGNMAGNTFLNLFLLGLVEGPGNMMGMILANKLGRRWTHTGLLGLNTLILGILMGVVMYQTDPENMYWSTPTISFLCMWVKMNISATFVVAYIQAMEIFPTCVRQSGIGFCSFISQMISIGGPYTINLGKHDLRYPYLALFMICLSGTVATSFLPETVGAKLPETLEDANTFGVKDKYFSFKPARSSHKYEAPVEQDIVKNNQI